MSLYSTYPIDHNSAVYWQAVELRDEVLRRPLGLEYSAEQLAAEHDQHHFVASDAKHQVGAYLALQTDDQHPTHIKMRQVAVAPHLQGQGIGRQLVRFVEAWAASEGYAVMYCHARDVAVSFYLKQGYAAVGEPFVEVGITHFYLQKSIR